MQAVASFTSAKVAGRYSTLELLGTGGMARVYRSLDDSSGRIVALKQLTSTDANAAALFESEFHTLAGLRHPCIIEVYDYGVDASGPYYTMELLDGRDVARQAPLPWKVGFLKANNVRLSGWAALHGERSPVPRLPA